MIRKISISVISLILVMSCCPKQESTLKQFRSDEVRLVYDKARNLFDCEVGYADEDFDSLTDISKYVEILDSAIALDPTDMEMKMTKAFWYSRKKDFKTQCEIYLDIYQMHKDKVNFMLIEIGICKDNLGQTDSADYYYNKFIQEEEKIIAKMGEASISQALNMAIAKYLVTEDEEKSKEMFYHYVDSIAVKNTDLYYKYNMHRWIDYPDFHFPNGRAKRNPN